MPRYELHQREVFFAYSLEQTKPAPARDEWAFSASLGWSARALLPDFEYLPTNGQRRVLSSGVRRLTHAKDNTWGLERNSQGYHYHVDAREELRTKANIYQ